MNRLRDAGYNLVAEHISGPLGFRHVVRSEVSGREWLADVMSPGDDKHLTVICENASRSRRWTDHPSMANVLAAEWLLDGRYFQVLEMTPAARPLSNRKGRLAEPELLMVAQTLVAGLTHMHRRELVHGTIAPTCIYQDGEQLRLGELWFAHNADGEPLYDGLSQYFPSRLPDFALPFASPEVLLGEPPERAADIFSL